jgi:hypothetical protein
MSSPGDSKTRRRRSRGIQALGLLLVGSVGLAVLVAWRQSAAPGSHARAPAVVFAPGYVPSRLMVEKETSTNEGDVVRHEIAFAPRSGKAAQATAVPLRIATTSYVEGLVDPMTGRLDGSAYAHAPDQRPVARQIQIRGHQGVVEYFGSRSTPVSGGVRTQPAGKIMVTWVERPGVYVQLIGRGLREKEILRIVESLHER